MSTETRTGPTMNVGIQSGQPDPTRPYRVWWVPQVPMEQFTVDCTDLPTAASLTHVLAMYDLFQYEHKVKPDYSNVGGVLAWDGEAGEWYEVDDEDVSDALLPAVSDTPKGQDQ